MNIVQYDAAEHYEVLSGWWQGHGQTPPPPEILPPTGALVPGICAAFLYVANAKVGFLDWYISNPKYSDKKRKNEALDYVSQALLKIAAKLELKRLTATTDMVRPVQRAMASGFTRKTVTLMEKYYGRRLGRF